MRALCFLLLALAGCPKTTVSTTSRVPELLVAADAVWADRQNAGIEAAEAALLEAWNEDPADPEVLWRMTRLTVTKGVLEPDPRASQYAYAEARALGMGCLDGDPAFTQARAELGWEEALLELAPERMGCAAWAGFAWARWLESHGGAAAALDLGELDLLLRRAERVGAPEAQSVAVWGLGVSLAVRPEWEGRDLSAARRHLERAIQLDPDALARKADMLVLVAIPIGDNAFVTRQRQAILTGRANTPEDAAAKQRVEELEIGGR